MKDVIAKLIARGISLDTIRNLTQYQLFSVYYALGDEDKFRAKLAGWKIEENENEEMTFQHILGFGM